MIQRKLGLLATLLLLTFCLWASDLKISWREGKDNLYYHPARLKVTYAENGKPALNAAVYDGKNFVGNTDNNGELISNTLNQSAVKYTLKACINDDCSKTISYQVIASEFPCPTFISMGEDPRTSMSFTWHTSGKIEKTIVECVNQTDKAGFQSQSVIRAKGFSYLHELVDVDKPEGIHLKVRIHKSTLINLTPDTRYSYRVGDGKNWREGTFLTAPEKNSTREIKFLFIADSQESSRENYQSMLQPILNKAFEANPDIRFIAHAGDFVNRGMNGQEWGWAFEAGEKYFRSLPMASVPGNHETGGVVTTGPQQKNQAYLPYFYNPSNHSTNYSEGSAYSFNYGSAHLLCLDIQNLYDAMEVKSKTGNEKYLKSAIEWIKKDLDSASVCKKWKIVTMHQPIYGANRDENELRAVLAPIFDKAKVDLVITGHDHYYFRSFPMRYDSLKNDGEIVTLDKFGTIYIIGGSTCSKMYPQKFAKPYQAVVMAKEYFPGRYPYLRNEPLVQQNYSTFTVKPDELHYQFFDRTGTLKDEILLKRDL